MSRTAEERMKRAILIILCVGGLFVGMGLGCLVWAMIQAGRLLGAL